MAGKKGKTPVARLNALAQQPSKDPGLNHRMDLVRRGYYEGKCNSCERERREQAVLLVKAAPTRGERICYSCAGEQP